MKLRAGTRGSRLAIAQTQIVLGGLRKSNPARNFEIVTINTKGDTDKRPLFTIDEKGIFEREINEAVISGGVDFAVHSLKDIPSNLSNELIIACIPKRAKPNDVLVSQKNLKIRDLPIDSIVGTSSLRRAIQVLRKRPDLNVKPIRGNVETRVKKSIIGEYDAVILAEAGLIRLGMNDVITERFNIRDFVPAAGQGAIGIVCRKDNHKLITLLKSIEDPQSRAEVDAERALLTKIEGGCRFPVGIVAITSADKCNIILYANVFSADGSRFIKLKKTGNVNDPTRLGTKMANLLIKKDVTKLSQGWHDAVEEWNKKL